MDNYLYFDFLKKKVLAIAGIKSISAADCKALSILLSNKKDTYISETTLKRVYGFARTRFEASAYTKDIIANFCGYQGWTDFLFKAKTSGSIAGWDLSVPVTRSKAGTLLKPFLDTMVICILLLKPVYGQDGTIRDFRIELVNGEMEKATGRKDLPGKLYSREYPGARKTGLFELMLKVMDTGKPEQTRYYYPYDGLDAWYSSMLVKTADGLWTAHYELSDIMGDNLVSFTLGEPQTEILR